MNAVTTDLLVIGAGACGLTAGLRALEAGAETIVLERDARPSGSTAMSSGFIPAPGTRFQRAIGINETPAQFARDIQKKAAQLQLDREKMQMEDDRKRDELEAELFVKAEEMKAKYSRLLSSGKV